MDPRSVARLNAERGFTTTQYVVAVGMSLVVFVMLANLLVDRYERGAIVAAVDEGARAGADIDAGPAECEQRDGQHQQGDACRELDHDEPTIG